MGHVKAWSPPEEKVQKLWVDFAHRTCSPVINHHDLHRLLLVAGKLTACGATAHRQAPIPTVPDEMRDELLSDHLEGIRRTIGVVEETEGWISVGKPETWEWVPRLQESIRFLHNLEFALLAAGDLFRPLYAVKQLLESRLSVLWHDIRQFSTIAKAEAEMICPEKRARFWWLPDEKGKYPHQPKPDEKEKTLGWNPTPRIRSLRRACGVPVDDRGGGTSKNIYDFNEKLEVILAMLPPPESFVIRKMFAHGPAQSGETIAAALGVSRQRVHQLKERAVAKLEAAGWTKMLQPGVPLPVVVKWAARNRS